MASGLKAGGWSPPRRIVSALVGAVLLIALFLRVCDLDGVPPGVQGDEMFNTLDASRLGSEHLPLYFPANYGREPLFIYLVALSTRLLGVSLWAVRLPAALGGLAVVLFTYLLARRLLGFRVGLLAAALTAVSFWPLMISRVGLRAVTLPVCQAVAMYALDRTVREHRFAWAAVAGLSFGLLPYTYIPGQLFLVVPLLWLPLAALIGRRRWESTRWMALVVTLALLVASPFWLFVTRNLDVAYARVGKLSYELDRLAAGDPEPVLRSARAVLGMFTWAGDPQWRYNVAGRPVFDRVTGGFFYLGLLVSLCRVRRPASLLWLLWLPVMLLPAAVTGSAPSFLRATGALVPTYILPAVGVDFVWGVVGRWRPACVAIPLLVGGGLLLVAADTWRDYFGEWAHNSRVCDVYGGDLAAAARYLRGYGESDTPAWISSAYAYDTGPVAFDILSDYPGPVRWFNGGHATVWPSPSHGRDVLLVFPGPCRGEPVADHALAPYLVYRGDAPPLRVYRVSQEALEETPWEISYPLHGRFDGGFELLGYDAPAWAERGGEIEFVLYWRAVSDHRYEQADPPWTFVCLEDDRGRCWSEDVQFIAYPMRDWTPGDVVAQRFRLAVPDGLPPQAMVFRLAQYDSAHEIVFVDPLRGGIPLRVGSLQVVGRVTEPPRWDADTPLFGELALLDFSLDPMQTYAGGEVTVSLDWQAVDRPGEDYIVRFELRDAWGAALSAEEGVWPGVYPPSVWSPGEVVRSLHEVAVPRDFQSDSFDLYLSVVDPASGLPLGGELSIGEVAVVSRCHDFALPAPQVPLEALFGDGVRLLGYDLYMDEPVGGGQVKLTLYWQALDGSIEEDYTVFVHLYDSGGGGILAQHDGPPGCGAAPTSTWLPGEVVADVHVLSLPSDLPGGSASLVVGMYRFATGERLPVVVDGLLQPDDRLVLTEIEVE